MSLQVRESVESIVEFIVNGTVPRDARARALDAFKDTAGVILAGSAEPVARMAQVMAAEESTGQCRVLGTSLQTSAGFAAWSNGIAAHALDYDDMCFVSLAHPSCALVPAALAAGELAYASGVAVLDAYAVGFELECRLGGGA